MRLLTDAEPSDSAVVDASSDHHTSSVSHQLGATEDRGSGNLLLTAHQTSQVSGEAGNNNCASADGLGSNRGPASSEPAGGSQTADGRPDGGDQISAGGSQIPDGGGQMTDGGRQMTDGRDHGASQAVESGTANYSQCYNIYIITI